MKWRILDGIGPFFRGIEQGRINWSKIPFVHLATTGAERRAQWDRIAADMERLCREAVAAGFNALTLDDVPHLVPHPFHGEELNARLEVFREEFGRLIGLVRKHGMEVLLTTDVMPVSDGVLAATGGRREALDEWFGDLVGRLLADLPEVAGVVVRIGESDGQDVRDDLRSRLHLRTPEQTRRMLECLLPVFEERGKVLIFRTWTVGAHRVGDLMWHRGTLERTLGGIESDSLLVSMKHGESDFFRYLPLNRAFFRVKQAKVLEGVGSAGAAGV